MSRVWSVARLTFAEGVRMKIVLVFLVVLLLLIIRMPFTLTGDGTLAGRVQNFLAYSLAALGVLLSLTTIFFSCAALAGEIKDRSLHLVVTKPVSRFEILLGKWLGVNLLNLVIVVLAGGAIYGLAYYLQGLPVQFQRDRTRLRETVWTARVAAKPIEPRQQIEDTARAEVRDRVQRGELMPAQVEAAVRARIDEGRRKWRLIGDGEERYFEFQGLPTPDREDAVVQIRYRVVAVPLTPDEIVEVGWVFCDPDTRAWLSEPLFTRERSNDTHQFLVRAQPVIKNGRALLLVANPPAPGPKTGFVFEGDESLVLLYPVGGFEANLARALLMITFRLGLLSAVALFFSIFTSFPVACFCSLAFYLVCLGSPFWLESMGVGAEGMPASIDPYGVIGPVVRTVLGPLVKIGFPDFVRYDGVRLLIEGLYVPYVLVGEAMLRTLAYGAVLLLLLGWLIFTQREVAEVQV